MNDKPFSGASLEKALKEDGLTQTPALLTGMVKSSEKSGHVSFSQSGCDMWVDLPTVMIENADHISQSSCRDHSHPVMRITLKEQKNAEGKFLLSLLAQAATNPSAEMPFGGSFRGPQFQGDMPPREFLVPDVPSRPEFGFGGVGTLGGFGFGGFGGRRTLPRCRWEQVVCGSTPPGVPPILCWVYCCTWPNGSKGCM